MTKIEILFSDGEGFCYGCLGQSPFTSSTLQKIGMVLTEHENGNKGKSQTYCYACGIRRIERLKEDLLAVKKNINNK